ncbi:Glycosyltransferase involved in cell wall bisynthesis [Sinosporangium album]|uniref:Glycosyltransferase involved in cell wall bisynthesis n=1 Tax=Sinosporangium album TaxID=504805 RepID=A0A1G7VTR6_9ACTN|nr:glycosyltransferase family 2 protein [Sinosporangium album]SDG63163.1 Glycosyltransferase involved in cell wall bisynthesis [Sinosporangium album]
MEERRLRISLVVPCYNERETVPCFHREVTRELALADVDYEIVFVDDGSSDGTREILRGLTQADKRVRFISLSRNFGQEAAILAGLKSADGDAVIIMDADLQHPPKLIHTMLKHFRAGCDQVVARRTRTGEGRLYTLAARVYYKLVNRLLDVHLLDGASEFRLIGRTALDALLSLEEYSRFSRGLFTWIGFDQVVIDYENVVRTSGASKWNLRKRFDYGLDGIMSFNNKPLRLAIYIGFFFTAIAALYMFWTVGEAILTGVDSPGYTTLLTAIVGLGGIQMVMLGIIGEYLGRVYYETKRRPHFLIREHDGERSWNADSTTAERERVPGPRSSPS